MYSLIPTIIFALIPEVIYFSLFLIFTKNLKNNRIVLFILLLIGYILLKIIFPLNIYFQICFTLYVPLVLRLLYKRKFHISDIFIFAYSSIFLILIGCISALIHCITNNYILAFIVNRILMFLILFLLKDKLNKTYKWAISQWNRNYERPNKIKAITIRQICVISLNIMIFILNFGIQYIINRIGS